MLEKVKFPEQIGVDSDVVKGYIDYLEKNNMDLDSFMVIKDGKIACEAYWSPNDETVPHDMYSLSKSVTAIAIGIAVDEGYIDLNTKIYEKYFPHKLRELKGKQKKWAQELTIHHVIAMQVGKVTSVLDDKEKEDWIDTLLDRPFKIEPGTEWKYISENAYLLSWILQKETGMTITEYLTPRLYEPLGMTVPHWDQSAHDVDAGGWGLKLTTLDIAKISMLYLNKGVYDGKRIFSEDWFNKCTYPHSKKLYPIFTDGSEYGYQIWIDHEIEDTVYRFTGLYGQFSFMFPKQNAAVVMTAKENRDEIFIKPLFKYFPRAFIEPTENVSTEKAEAFAEYMASKKDTFDFTSPVKRNTAQEKFLNGREFKLLSMKNCSVLGATTFFMWRQKTGSLNDIKFNFGEDSLEFSFVERGNERATIKAGMNGEYIRNYLHLGEDTIVTDAKAAWSKDGSLELLLHHTGRAQMKRFKFRFKGKNVWVASSVTPNFDAVAKFNIQFNNGMRVPDPLYKVIQFAIPVFNKCYADPDAVGRIAD